MINITQLFNNNFISKRKKEDETFFRINALVSLLICFTVILLNNYLIYSFLLLSGFILYIRYGINVILALALILLLTVTSSLGEGTRLLVQIFSFTVLGFYFFFRFGFSSNRFPKIPKELNLFFIFFLISLSLSFIMSDFQQVAMLYLARIFIFFVITYLVYSLIENQSSIKMLLTVLFIVSSIITFSIFYELALNNFNFLDFSINMYFRSGGLISNVNAAAGLFAITFPLTVVLLFGVFNNKTKMALKVFGAIILVGIILTNSRAAYISILASLLFILYNLKRKYFYTLLIGLALILFSIIILPPLNEFFTLFLRVQDGISYREYLWRLAFDIIDHNWAFGVGPGAYGQVMFKYFPVMLDSWQGIVFTNLFNVTNAGNVSHNFYLGFFAELGIMGLITSLLLPSVFIWISYKTIKWYKIAKDNYYYLAIGITSVGLGLFIRANLDNVSIITNGYLTTDLPFWIVFSILTFLFLQSKKEQSIEQNV